MDRQRPTKQDPRYYTYINAVFIRRIIKRKMVRHHEVAKALGTTPRYWSQMLNHERCPGPEMSRKITIYFRGHSWDEVFSMTSSTENP
jgi:hypothetical protein